MAGVSWTLRARNDAEMVDLIEELKSPEFGQKTREEEEEQADAEIDEEQLLDQPKESKKCTAEKRPSSAGSKGSVTQIHMSEEEKAKVQLEGRHALLWDRYNKSNLLNKV